MIGAMLRVTGVGGNREEAIANATAVAGVYYGDTPFWVYDSAVRTVVATAETYVTHVANGDVVQSAGMFELEVTFTASPADDSDD